jgi:hypothetical protein
MHSTLRNCGKSPTDQSVVGGLRSLFRGRSRPTPLVELLQISASASGYWTPECCLFFNIVSQSTRLRADGGPLLAVPAGQSRVPRLKRKLNSTP